MARKHEGLRNWMREESGVALPLVLIFTIILTTTGLSFLYLGGEERILTQRKSKKTQAFHLAEAGIERALVDLRQDFANDPADPSWADSDVK